MTIVEGTNSNRKQISSNNKSFNDQNQTKVWRNPLSRSKIDRVLSNVKDCSPTFAANVDQWTIPRDCFTAARIRLLSILQAGSEVRNSTGFLSSFSSLIFVQLGTTKFFFACLSQYSESTRLDCFHREISRIHIHRQKRFSLPFLC